MLSPATGARRCLSFSSCSAAAAPHFANLAPVPLTGEYDAETETAVRVMQGVFGLPSDRRRGLRDLGYARRSAQRALRARAPRVGAALSGYKTATDRKSLP